LKVIAALFDYALDVPLSNSCGNDVPFSFIEVVDI
jgi:hypothetical protein